MAQIAKKIASIFLFSELERLGVDESPFATAAMKKNYQGYIVISTHPNHAALHAGFVAAQRQPWYVREWRRFHKWTITGPLENPMAFLMPFFAGLPDSGCKCQTHALQYVKESPPPVSRGDRIKWGYEFHAATNRRIGKHTLNFEEFKKMYGISNSQLEI